VQLALGYRAAALEKPNQYGLFVDEIRVDASPNDPIFALVYRSFDRVLRVIRRCLAAGLFPGRDEFAVGRFLLGIVHGLASLELRGILGPPPRAAEVWRLSVTAALAGLRQPPDPNSVAAPSEPSVH
jgi:hypothetical protein